MGAPREGPLIALEADGIEIPPGIFDLRRFRAWAQSPRFPDHGRIDWVAGRLEVDMSPEDLFTHGSPKSAIAIELGKMLQETERGLVFIDRARLSSTEADLSAEPDILVLFAETVKEGRARLVPKASGAKGRYVEIEGAVDLVAECISDASKAKDRERLREAYECAGVREYWLVDARRQKIDFQILLHQGSRYVSAPADAKGFASSKVLGRKVRLIRSRQKAGLVFFRLDVHQE